MPRYYFNVHYNGEPGSADAEGVELPGDDAAGPRRPARAAR